MTLRILGLRPTLGLGAGLLLAAMSACDAPSPTASGASDLAAPMAFSTTSDVTNHTVEVNAKHGNAQGKINLRGTQNGNGKDAGVYGPQLTVSVLGTADIDMSTIMWSTIFIGDATTTPITGVTEKSNKYQGSIVDLNGDGILDLQLHFSIEDMIANGNLSESTTQLCLVGAGAGYTISGLEDVEVMPYTADPNAGPADCAGNGGGDDDGGDDDGNGNGNGGGNGGKVEYSNVELIPWWPATSPDKMGWMSTFKYDPTNTDDPDRVYPGWITTPLTDFHAGPGDNPWGIRVWGYHPLPIGSEQAGAEGFLADTCGLTASIGYRWEVDHELVVRTDFAVPTGATNVVIQFLVDNDAQIFVNGTSLNRTFVSAQNSGCASYSKVVTVKVPDEVLSADGNNMLAIWARDFGYVNYLDYRITMDVPVAN